jgi:hypothetical protein
MSPTFILVVMDCGRGEQGRNRRERWGCPSIAQDEHAVILSHGDGRQPADLRQGRLQSGTAVRHTEQHRDGRWLALVRHLRMPDLRKILVGQERVL